MNTNMCVYSQRTVTCSECSDCQYNKWYGWRMCKLCFYTVTVHKEICISHLHVTLIRAPPPFNGAVLDKLVCQFSFSFFRFYWSKRSLGINDTVVVHGNCPTCNQPTVSKHWRKLKAQLVAWLYPFLRTVDPMRLVGTPWWVRSRVMEYLSPTMDSVSLNSLSTTHNHSDVDHLGNSYSETVDCHYVPQSSLWTRTTQSPSSFHLF